MPAPPTTATSYAGMGMGMGALTGLFASKAKPTAITISEGEVLLPKDSTSVNLFHSYFKGLKIL